MSLSPNKLQNCFVKVPDISMDLNFFSQNPFINFHPLVVIYFIRLFLRLMKNMTSIPMRNPPTAQPVPTRAMVPLPILEPVVSAEEPEAASVSSSASSEFSD